MKEVARLRAQLEVLDRQWNHKFRLAAFGLLAIPLYAIFESRVWGTLVIVATPVLVLTQAYLIGTRRKEARELILQTERDIETVRGGTVTRSRNLDRER